MGIDRPRHPARSFSCCCWTCCCRNARVVIIATLSIG